MKKFLLILCLGLFINSLQAQPLLRLKARSVIKRTSAVVLEARDDLKQGQKFTGDFARAVNHQRFARVLFARHNFMRAAHHSKIARMFAIRVIRENNKQVPSDYELNAEEKSLLSDDVSEEELKKELLSNNSNADTKDEVYLNIKAEELEPEP